MTGALALETGFADVNGTRIYYQVCGQGPAVLLLHGFTLDHRMWRAQVASLAARHRVIAYDARGFGRSAMPGAEPYAHFEDAAALCEQLGAHRVVVVGHSIGAQQMLELALARPRLVAGWVGICASGLGVPFPPEVQQMFGAIRTAAREHGVDAAKRIWERQGWFADERVSPALRGELDAMLADYSGWHWLNDNPARGLVPPAAERLHELRVPALVVTGGQDLAHNDAVAAAVLGSVKGATALRLPHAGHMANMDDPAAVNLALEQLVSAAVA